jgi:hypothetical protein
MNPLDRGKLARVLGMLGSAHDGEIAAAGRAANELVRGAGLTWPEVIEPPSALVQPYPDRAEEDYPLTIEDCLESSWLTPWERKFLGSIRYRTRLTKKQIQVFEDIKTKIRRAAR